MNTKLVIAALAGGAIVTAIAASAKQCGGESSKEAKAAAKWEKMKHVMDEMPDDFPPRVMFDNLAAIRENTDQMLELLRAERATSDDDVVAAT